MYIMQQIHHYIIIYYIILLLYCMILYYNIQYNNSAIYNIQHNNMSYIICNILSHNIDILLIILLLCSIIYTGVVALWLVGLIVNHYVIGSVPTPNINL